MRDKERYLSCIFLNHKNRKGILVNKKRNIKIILLILIFITIIILSFLIYTRFLSHTNSSSSSIETKTKDKYENYRDSYLAADGSYGIYPLQKVYSSDLSNSGLIVLNIKNYIEALDKKEFTTCNVDVNGVSYQGFSINSNLIKLYINEKYDNNLDYYLPLDEDFSFGFGKYIHSTETEYCIYGTNELNDFMTLQTHRIKEEVQDETITLYENVLVRVDYDDVFYYYDYWNNDISKTDYLSIDETSKSLSDAEATNAFNDLFAEMREVKSI